MVQQLANVKPDAHEADTQPKPQPPEVLKQVTMELHKKAWPIYRETQTVAAVARGVGIRPSLAHDLIHKGNPRINIPSLQSRLQALNAMALQIDQEEALRSIAVGRGAIRKLIALGMRKLAAIEQDPSLLSAKDWLGSLPKLVELNETLTAKPTEGASDVLRAAGDLQSALGGLLSELANSRLPMGRAMKVDEAALAELEAENTGMGEGRIYNPSERRGNGESKGNGNGNGEAIPTAEPPVPAGLSIFGVGAEEPAKKTP
jgi:hypothetical protein